METANKNDYIEEAEKAAAIITTGIANQNYSDISQQLESITESNELREQYVFKHRNNYPLIALICVSVLFIVCFVYFSVIGIAIMLFSKKFLIQGIIFLLVSLLLLAFNITIVIKSIALLNFHKRYESYYEIIKYKKIELLDDIIAYSKLKSKTVIKDIHRAIKSKLIPQGHFGTDDIILIVSDETNEIYLANQAVYDRYYRKELEERKRIKDRTDDIQHILDLGQSYIDKIHKSNDIIKDKLISQKLDKMEKIVRMIFLEVDNNPQNSSNLGLFLNYYLPTTAKLLEAYIDADEKTIIGQTITSVKSEIEKSLDSINATFEGILDKFYQEQQMDIISDISAMETMMQSEVTT